MTRARDWLSLSRHERVNVQARRAEPVLRRSSTRLGVDPPTSRLPAIERSAHDATTIPITRHVQRAGVVPRLRPWPTGCARSLGFQPRLAPELGYGKAVHHVLRTVAEHDPGDRRACRRPARSTASSTPASSCRRQQAGPPTAEGRGSPAGRPSTRRLTPTTCSGSGRPSGRSSCTSTASPSAAAPT